MMWLLLIPGIWLLGKAALRLFALDAMLKKQQRIRVEMAVGDASKYAEIDGSDLQPLSDELQALGFVAHGDLISTLDYAPLPDVAGVPAASVLTTAVEVRSQGVDRIFGHPEHGCYACLNSAVTTATFPAEMKRPESVRVVPFRVVFASMSGTEDDSWAFVTHNREVDKFSLRHRHPRGPARRMVGASAREMLQSHLAERDDIAARAGIAWDGDTSLAKWEAYEMKILRHIRGVNERATLLGVAWHLLTYRLHAHDLWLGELRRTPAPGEPQAAR